MPNKKGKLIVIEGTDGSGKGTQTKKLVSTLRDYGIPFTQYSFPNYGQPGSELVQHYLNGKLGTTEEVSAYQGSILYAADRLFSAKSMREDIEAGKIVICDRYVTSNLVHQSSKIDDLGELEEYIAWIEDLEYNKLNLPKPDLVLFLDMPWEVSYRLIEEKAQREYIEEGKGNRDMHEGDKNHLKFAYKRACYLADINDSWKVISCSEDGVEPLPKEIISEDIWDTIRKEFGIV
ncbi:MAG: thymidylate kinase [Patescibacteria group bacterium]|nr:thymidylate kinase [Patescibacteria group bacterium]